MNKKCRILSISLLVIVCVVSLIAAGLLINKNKSKIVYATSVEFKGASSSFNISLFNTLFISNDMVEITPSDCEFLPEFTIKRYNHSEENLVTSSKLEFDEVGTYVLTCKVKASKDYYKKAYKTIKVVEHADDATIYIKNKSDFNFYEEDEIDENLVFDMRYPQNAILDVRCSPEISYNNGKFIALNSGAANVEIYLTYDNVTIYHERVITIKPKIEVGKINLIAKFNGSVIENNELTLSMSVFTKQLTFELINVDNQNINCWTSGSNLEIINSYPPIITLKTLAVGEAVIYVSPEDYPSIIFEIHVTIIDKN